MQVLAKAYCMLTFGTAWPELELEKKREEKPTPFGVNLMRSQLLYRAAKGPLSYDKLSSTLKRLF